MKVFFENNENLKIAVVPKAIETMLENSDDKTDIEFSEMEDIFPDKFGGINQDDVTIYFKINRMGHKRTMSIYGSHWMLRHGDAEEVFYQIKAAYLQSSYALTKVAKVYIKMFMQNIPDHIYKKHDFVDFTNSVLGFFPIIDRVILAAAIKASNIVYSSAGYDICMPSDCSIMNELQKEIYYPLKKEDFRWIDNAKGESEE